MQRLFGTILFLALLLAVVPEVLALNQLQQQEQVRQVQEKTKFFDIVASKWSPTPTPAPKAVGSSTPSPTPSFTETPTGKG